MNLLILNGPNLNLLGTRERNIYGSQRFEEILPGLQRLFPHIHLEYRQSNHEGELIDWLHEAGFSKDGIIFNAGAYTHTSLALADAIAAVNTPVIEVHISNIFKRESFRHHSFLAPVCAGSISGLGLDVYQLAIQAFDLKNKEKQK